MNTSTSISQFECPLSLEPITSQDATVVSCGHHFTKQGIFEYLNSKLGGIISTINALFDESVQESLQATVVNCPICAKRIRSVNDDPQFRETIRAIEMLSSIAIPSSVAEAAASPVAAASAVAPCPAMPSLLTITIRDLSGSRYSFMVDRSEKFSKIWKYINENRYIPVCQISTLVNGRAVFPWEPINAYVPLGEKELNIHLVVRIGRTKMPEFINELARSSLAPTASEDAVHNLAVSIFSQAIHTSLQELEG